MNEIAARILHASMRLFAEKGYAATSVREIVQAAKVTNPMLYYYFDSKEGVFRELMTFLFQSLNEQLASVFEDETSLERRLRAVARAHFEACRESPEALRFIYSVLFGPILSSPSLDVLALIEEHHKQVREAFEQALGSGEFRPRPGVDALFATEQFMGLINNHLLGVLTLYDHFSEHPDFASMLDNHLSKAALDRMFDFFFSGAGQLS